MNGFLPKIIYDFFWLHMVYSIEMATGLAGQLAWPASWPGLAWPGLAWPGL